MAVHHDEDHGAHWSGVERCASIWACPVCSAVIRAERARDIQDAARVWQEQRGGALALVTLTLRHGAGDSLADNLDAVLRGWQKVVSGPAWRRKVERLGIAGFVRSVEVTYGVENGWHPHAHVLLFLDEGWSDEQREDFEGWLYERWARIVVRLGASMPTRLRGVDVRCAGEDGEVVAQYLAKVQEHDAPEAGRDKVGAEVARFDLKSGRAGRLMPFELLDGEASPWAARLWVEYVEATYRRRAITWSRGLRESLDLDRERTDEEVIEDTDAAPVVAVISGAIYDRIKNRPDALAEVLESVEDGSGLDLLDPDTGELVSLCAPATDRPEPARAPSLSEGDRPPTLAELGVPDEFSGPARSPGEPLGRRSPDPGPPPSSPAVPTKPED